MSDTARDYQSSTSPDTNGLDDLFIVQDTPPQDSPVASGSPAQDISEPQDSHGQDWTVSEAAKHLSVSEKTILRRLQKGALTGYKQSGQFGLEWRVHRTPQDRTFASVEVVQDRTAQDIQFFDQGGQDSPGQNLLIEQQREEIAQLRKQIEGAIYRNGYLEAKLEERENAIKLLTDSQHKPGWWTKFSTWFFKIQ